VAWSIGRGDRVRLGEDPWVGVAGNYILSRDLKTLLWERGLTTLGDIGVQGARDRWLQNWISEEDLGLHGDLAT
jgi:hypothetical protein